MKNITTLLKASLIIAIFPAAGSIIYFGPQLLEFITHYGTVVKDWLGTQPKETWFGLGALTLLFLFLFGK